MTRVNMDCILRGHVLQRFLACTALFVAVVHRSARAEVHDLGELRSAIADAGVQLTLSYYGETLGNPAGGARQGVVYQGRLGLIIDADLDKLIGWSGASFHASVHLIHGLGLSGAYIDNLMTVSGIEAPATTRLFNLWIEQAFASNAGLRIGQITAAQEFLISQFANLFVNSTFGWPLIAAVDLPSGGPAYPEAALGARIKITPSDHLTFMVAIFNGDPAGPGPENPVERDIHGLAFRLEDSPLLIAEVDYAYNPAPIQRTDHQEGSQARSQSSASESQSSGQPGTVKVGGWYHTGRFADQRFDRQGRSLADPLSTGEPMQHRGNFGIYAVLDQMIWRLSGDGQDQGLSGFVRASASPGDRNLVDLYVDVGLTFKGLISSRKDDTSGIAFAYARISPAAAGLDRDKALFTGVQGPIEDYEATIELTYQALIVEGWSVQPDLQYILHPGGNVPNPLDPTATSPMKDAFVVGVRSMMRF